MLSISSSKERVSQSEQRPGLFCCPARPGLRAWAGPGQEPRFTGTPSRHPVNPCSQPSRNQDPRPASAAHYMVSRGLAPVRERQVKMTLSQNFEASPTPPHGGGAGRGRGGNRQFPAGLAVCKLVQLGGEFGRYLVRLLMHTDFDPGYLLSLRITT